MRKFSSSLLLFIVVLLLPFSSQAYSSNIGKWYQIELIVFSHFSPQALMSEQWSVVDPNYKKKSRTITLNTNTALSATEGQASFVLLPQKRLRMRAEKNRIDEKSGYHVLLHLAWRQQVQGPRSAIPIHIFGGNVYDSSGKLIATDSNGLLPYSRNSIWQINGTLKISVLRYLNVNLNLLFAAPLSELSKISRDYKTMNNVFGRFAYFRLLQTRRMRSRELNYIDHPLYGVLIKIVPMKVWNAN